MQTSKQADKQEQGHGVVQYDLGAVMNNHKIITEGLNYRFAPARSIGRTTGAAR